MRVEETDLRLPAWLNRLLNTWPFLIDTESVHSVAVAWLFKEDGKWNFKPRLCETKSLFYNAVFFLRLSLPFGFHFGLKIIKNRSIQTTIGWKLNGRFGFYLFRAMTDESAARGVQGPAFGQSTGWDFGTH